MLKMGSPEKSFDAVAMMRRVREGISAKIEGMTLEEELEWLASQELGDPRLERLRARAIQQTNAGSRRKRP